jgi:hypothetical protein
LSDIDNNQLQKIDEEDSSNNEKKIDIQSGSDSKVVDNEGYVGINKCVGPDSTPKDENDKAENERSIYKSTKVDEENVGYVGNVGISARVSTNENEILTNDDSMKANSQNNNLPIFNYNYNYNNNNNNKIDSLSAADKKRDRPPLEPTHPTLPTSAIPESSFKLKCSMCDYEGIEVDLGVHIFKEHRYNLKRLKRNSLDFNIRTDYIVEQIKLEQEKNKD